MEKEIIETYYFNPTDFDERGRRYEDGVSFRDVVNMNGFFINATLQNMHLTYMQTLVHWLC